MWAVARRPRWIATLFLALAVAAGFAALGQWQLDRSVASGTVVERDTETIKPITQVAAPQEGMTAAADGQRVRVEGQFVDGDFLVLGGRYNGGVEGYWLVGHFETDPASGDAALAVALGWAETEEAASSVVDGADVGSVTLTGRYVAADTPQQGDFEGGDATALSPPALINSWAGFSGDVYAGYLVADEAPAGLDAIDSPVPSSEIALNWLNIFYAAEWAVFAIFAIFIWYRLVRDVWEREIELEEETAESRGAVPSAVGEVPVRAEPPPTPRA